eukprot:CAMPEP_0177375154 /NCGR_PEP_ID=MMETSP0368-20130122/44544_1 /TAXON_ID=447022 ORGANISM="Scrippsiella hangoei-like, Strain SHHI-4" /NCGR_SAMPLE_ID=MMETSP0368 /ASSEMBLY_ACC=CAM_ASM_000363 /LENGTH=83 /DNA_ID=CAMNT_0018838807 /DNA_START=129 /DNA_END=380 /DNA_ORIENTATION=-
MCGIRFNVAAKPPSPTTRNRSIAHLCPRCLEYASLTRSIENGPGCAANTVWMFQRKSSMFAGGLVGAPPAAATIARDRLGHAA